MKNERAVKQSYAGGAFFLVCERLFRACADLVSWVLIARFLGPDGLGLISFAQGLVALFFPLVHLGLDNFLVIDLVERRRSNAKLVGTVIALKLLSATVAFLTLLLITYTSFNDRDTIIAVAILGCILFFQSSNVFELFFSAIGRNYETAKARSLATVFSLASKLVIIALGLSWEWIAVSLLADWVFVAFVLWLLYRLNGNNIQLAEFWHETNHLLTKSWPLILSGVTIVIYMKSDLVMLRVLVNDAEVGIYSAGAKISEALYFFPMVIAAVYFPKILSRKQESREAAEKELWFLFSFLSTMSLLAIFVLTATASPLISSLFGPDYSRAIIVLQIHVWATLSVFVGVVRSKWLSSEGLQTKDFQLNLAGAAINVVLNLFLIPEYGAAGAAVATVISYCSATLVLPWLIKDLRPITAIIYRSLFDFSVFLNLVKQCWSVIRNR